MARRECGGCTFFTPFSINRGFIDGLNTLEFRVSGNTGTGPNPYDLRVEMKLGSTARGARRKPM